MSELSAYFEKSQHIKKEIESDSELLKKIELCFLRRIERFSYGSTNEIYTLGKTKSGIYVALRKESFYRNLDDSISRFNTYCQNAETLATSSRAGLIQNRPRSVNFCIGLIFNSETAGIITEDISEGRKYKLIDEGKFETIRVKNNKPVNNILIDLDELRNFQFFEKQEIISTADYFSKEYRLEIKATK